MLPLRPRAMTSAVVAYVHQSAMMPATKPATESLAPNALKQPEYEKPRERADDAHGKDIRPQRGQTAMAEKEGLYQKGDGRYDYTDCRAEHDGRDSSAARVRAHPDKGHRHRDT